jgi:hypothetical protein
MASLAKVRSPIIAEMVRLMEPISPVYANRAIRNRWRHYERWRERLDGFIAIGDAYCAYNPVYAQGMTAAAISSRMLLECLDKYEPTNPELPREFFKAQATVQHDPWLLAAGVDLRFPFTVGDRPLSIKLFNFYLDSVGIAAKDPTVRKRLVEVAQLLRPISDLFEPAIACRVGVAAIVSVVRKLSRILRQPEPLVISPMPPLASSELARTEPAAA